MGSVHARPTSTRMKKNQHNSTRSHGNRQSSSLLQPPVYAIIRGVLLALAASSLPFLIIYTLPSLKFFLFEATPSLWRHCSCHLFTPTNLFVLLNLLILSIFAMAHRHSGDVAAAASASSLLKSRARDDCTQQTSEEAPIKLDDQRSADFRLVNEVESNVEQINNQPPNHGANYKDDDPDLEAENTGIMVFQEIIPEAHYLQQAGDDEYLADRQTHKPKKAEPESKKAEKAKVRHSAPAESKKAATSLSSCGPGNPLSAPSFINIDSLLSEESSIFTLAQNRPLPSARFTHKRATKLSGLDRPLSPLKMSRPILKRGDTLDATWKAICESKRHSSPLNRHHHSKHTKKVGPYDEIIEGIANQPRVSSPSPLSPIKQRSKNVTNSLQDRELAKANLLTKREPSMPQEELNAKVESFISRFNERMRIQREKSLLEYKEMVGRGSS